MRYGWGRRDCGNFSISALTLRTKETDFGPANVTPRLQVKSRPCPALNELESQFSYR